MNGVLRDISFESFCEHHMAPIIGHAHVGYLPTDGSSASASSRVVGRYGAASRCRRSSPRKLRVHQRYSQTRGVGVVIDAVHQCMTTRGGSQTRRLDDQSKMLGTFRADASTRAEFLRFIDIEGRALRWISFVRSAASVRHQVDREVVFVLLAGLQRAEPTTWRAIFRRARLVIEMTRRIRSSRRAGVANRSFDAHRRLRLRLRFRIAELKRRWCWHPGQILALCRTTALQCGHIRVAPKVPPERRSWLAAAAHQARLIFTFSSSQPNSTCRACASRPRP